MKRFLVVWSTMLVFLPRPMFASGDQQPLDTSVRNLGGQNLKRSASTISDVRRAEIGSEAKAAEVESVPSNGKFSDPLKDSNRSDAEESSGKVGSFEQLDPQPSTPKEWKPVPDSTIIYRRAIPNSHKPNVCNCVTK